MWIIHHHKEWLEQGRGAGAELHLASRVGEGKGSCRSHSLSEAETAENAKIKLLFQTGFDEAELRSYTSVIHANVYQTIKILYEGAKELSQVESDSSKYVISPDNQETYLRGSILQLPDCAQYFMENLDRLAEADYVPTKEDVLYARVRTNGVVQIQFSPVGENKRGGEEAREMRGESGFIFLKVLMRYDQMLFEDETTNRMMETKELFDWVLKQRCFEKTSFMLFLNKFDIFEKKIQKVPLSVCEWFKDYQPIAPGKQETFYKFVKKKFEELYFQSSKPDRVDRVFKIYRTMALDQKLVKKTFNVHQLVKIVPQDHDSDELWSAIRGDDCVEYGYVHPECRRQ
uniref:Guanine nucleotide-binding protein alpha subunit n=1 Tax=Oryza glumipatula TaxID=40148 RepID=A0A0D9ZXN6_9ORYZ